MSETQTDVQAQLAHMLAQLQASGAQLHPQMAAQMTGWNKPVAPPEICAGVSIPIKINTPAGSLRVYLNYSGSGLANPETLMELVESLERQGVPLDFWRAGNASWGKGGSGSWRR